MITHSDSIAKIGPAILAVQQAVDHVAKTNKNPHFGNSYADLNAFLHALRGSMADNEIMMTQGPGMEDGNVVVDTLLLHSSGEWLRCRSAAPMQKADPQGVGSAITYLRRYSLAALFAVPQEDDDGNAASGGGQQAKSQPARNGSSAPADDMIACPACDGPMWDNRDDEKSSINGGKRPDIKCKDKDGCDTAIWLKSWRDDLIKDVVGLREAGVIDAAERERAESAVGSLSPAKMQAVAEWVQEKSEAVPA